MENNPFQTLIDYLKYLTGLSSGSIVIVSSFLNQAFDEPKYLWLPRWSIVLFALVICLISICFTLKLIEIGPGGENDRFPYHRVFSICIMLIWIAFPVAFMMLAAFTFINL